MENLNKKIIFLTICLGVFLPLTSLAQSVNLTAFSRCASTQAYIDLNWSSDLTNPTYYVQRKIGAGDFVEIYSTLSTSYSDSVDSDKDYTYKIRAVAGSNTYYSNEQFIAATYCPPLLSVSPGCIGSQAQANLNWLSGISGSPSYYVLRKIQGETSFNQIAQASGTSYQDQTIDSDKNYVYQIRAEREGDIYYSNQVTSIAIYCPPVISPPSAICQDNGPHIILNWSPASGSLLTYEIYRDGQKISQTQSTSYDDGPNIEATRNYDYFIKAVWQDGQNSNSETAPAVAAACPPKLNLSSNCLTESPGGPQITLSWNNLLGVQNYQIYRKIPGASNFTLLTTTAATNYADNLAESLPTYSQTGQVSYYVKAIWLTEQKDSLVQQIDIPRCSPYLKVESVCDSSGLLNPEMRLSWTATQSATLYNIYRDDSFYSQITNPNTINFIDYLDPSPQGDCPGKICSHTYKVDAIVTGFPTFSSNEVAKNIDCATPIPPSPAPVMSLPSAICVSGDSRVSLSWTPSDNVVYYTLYRNEVGIINLLETSYIDSGVESGQLYVYRITAFGRGGTYTNSVNSQTITAMDCTQPSIPTLSLSGGCEIGKPYINLSWSETTNTLKYEIYRGTSPSGIALLTVFEKGSLEFSTRTWKDTTVSTSTNYYYQVVAFGPIGVPSSPSDIKSISTLACLPTTPVLTLNTACETGNAVNNLSWTTNAANTSRYEIFRYDFSTTTPIQTIFNTSVKNWKDTNVLQQRNYRYKVEAVGYGASPPRATQGYKNITTYNCAPPGPFSLTDPPNTYCQGSYPQTGLSWSASSNSTSYDLFQNRLNLDNSIAETNTFTNAVSPFTDWGLGKALSFDGTNDYVAIPNTQNLLVSTQQLTLETWVLHTAVPSSWSWPNIISKGSSPLCLQHSYDGQYFEFALQTDTGRNYIFSTTRTDMSLNTWRHVVGTWDGSTMRLYVNGVEESSSAKTGTFVDTSYNFNIGRASEDGRYFSGIIDEVRIYSRALTATEISDHSKGIYSGATDPALIGLWHFDEGAGQTVSDSSNFGNNGTRGASTAVEAYDPTWVSNSLQSQTKYSWQTKAIGPGGSTLSNTTSPTLMPICPPTKPGLVLNSFCEIGTNLPTATLRWSYTTSTTKYEIYRQDKGLIKTIDQGDLEFYSRTWTDNNSGIGLTGGTTYTYYIKAIGSTGLTNQSDSIPIIAPVCSAPTKPQNLTATFACGGTGNSYPRVNLSWQDSQNATSYSIYRDGVFVATIADNDSPTYSYTDSPPGVSVNTFYSYFVTAAGPGGSTPSDAASLTTGYCIPSTPLITTLTTFCENSAPANNISWLDPDVEARQIFNNGFEEGDFSKWSGTLQTNGITSVGTTNPYQGTYHSQFISDGVNQSGSGGSYYNIPTTQTYLYLRAYYKFNSLPGANGKEYVFNRMSSPQSGNLARVSLRRENNTYFWRLTFKGNTADSATFTPQTNTWYSIELFARVNTAAGEAKIWVDGGLKASLSGINASADININQVRVWVSKNEAPAVKTFRLDSAIISNTYIGPGIPIYNTDKYKIYRTTGVLPTETDLIKTITTTDPEFSSRTWKDNLNLSPSANYYYWVKAAGPVGETSLSVSKSITEYSCGLTPDAPTLNLDNLTCSDNLPYATLSWSNSANAYTYHLYRKNPDASTSIYSTRLSPFTDPRNFTLSFDGVNNYVDMGDPADGDLDFAYSDFSISTWVYTPVRDTSGNVYLIVNKWNYSTTVGGYGLATRNGRYTMQLGSDALCGILWYGNAFNVDLTAATWEHVVVTIDRDGYARLYINGTEKAAENISAKSNCDLSSSYPFQVGRRGFWTGNFNGLIDETRIYNRVLSADEINQLYQGSDSNDTGLMGSWHLDEGTGSAVSDSSGKGNNGTIYGATWIVPSGKNGDALPLEAGETYKYTVKAIGVDRISNPSNEISINKSCLPVKPDLTVTPQCSAGNSQLLLDWGDDPNTSYWSIYKRRVGDPSFAFVANVAPPQSSFSDNNVESTISYEYYLEAVGVGVSTFSDIISEVAQFCYLPPSKPSISSPEGSTESKCFGYSSRIFIDWEEDPAGNTISYNIWRKNTTLGETDFSKVFNNLPASVTQYADIVSEAEKYIYKVEAAGSGSGNTVFSDPSSEVTAFECSKIPPFPATLHLNLVYSVDHQVAVSIGWTDSGNEEEYRVFRRLSGEAQFPRSNQPFWQDLLSYISDQTDYSEQNAQYTGRSARYKIFSFFLPKAYADYDNPLVTLSADVLNYVDYTVTDGETYEYQIMASNINGETLSNIIQVSVPIARPGDFTLTASYLGDGRVYLSWTEALTSVAGGQVTYKILRSSTETFNSSTIICSDITTPPRKCYDNSPTISELYYKAVATNNGGSTDSNVFPLGLPVPFWKEVAPQ